MSAASVMWISFILEWTVTYSPTGGSRQQLRYFPPFQIKIWLFQQALQEFPVVFYIDTSTFFSKHATVGDFVNRIGITDNQVLSPLPNRLIFPCFQGPHAYLVDQTTHSTYAATNPGIFDWLAPQGDLYPKQHQSGKMIYVRTKATMDLAMKWFRYLYSLYKSLGSSSVLWKSPAWPLQAPNWSVTGRVTRFIDTPTAIGNCIELQ